MDTGDALINNFQTAQMVCGMYLSDLTDAESMTRPHPQCNHVNWQVGHILASQHSMAEACVSGAMPPLPEGFADKYSRETCVSDDPAAFVPMSELLTMMKSQGEAVVAAIGNMSSEDFGKPAPEKMKDYAPTLGAVASMIGSHWMMHAGQWVVVRRQLGRDILI